MDGGEALNMTVSFIADCCQFHRYVIISVILMPQAPIKEKESCTDEK